MTSITIQPLLTKAQSIVEDRESQYGDPLESFSNIARRWSITTGMQITPRQVGLMMIDLKLARLQNNEYDKDSLVDIAGYAACVDRLGGY